jgi:hypothetical protein
MDESVLTAQLAGLGATVTRTLQRFRAALAAALTRGDGSSVEPYWVDGMPSRARRAAAPRLGDVRRSAVFDEWLTWRQ